MIVSFHERPPDVRSEVRHIMNEKIDHRPLIDQNVDQHQRGVRQAFTTGCVQFLLTSVNTIHPQPEIHEHIYMIQRLRNIVHDFMHIPNNIETNVTNNANNTTHTDEFTAQH